MCQTISFFNNWPKLRLNNQNGACAATKVMSSWPRALPEKKRGGKNITRRQKKRQKDAARSGVSGAIKLVDAVGCRFLWHLFYDFITQPLLSDFESLVLCECAGMSGRFLRQYFQINSINRDLLIKFLLLCLPGIGKLYRFLSLIGHRGLVRFG